MNGKQLKNSILQWAIQGKLVPQDPNDEPASILLEKIRTEKARLVKEKKIKKDKNESIIFRGEDNSHYEKSLATGEVKCIDEEIPFEIPAGWEWVRLNDLITNATGLSYQKELLDHKTPDMIRVLRGGNIEDGAWSKKDDDIMISSEYVRPELLLKKGTFITPAVTSLEQMGKTGLVLSDEDKTVVGGFVLMLSPILKDECLISYLFIVFQTGYYKSYCKQITKKSGQAFYNLSRPLLMQFLVPIPSRESMNGIIREVDKVRPFVSKYSVVQSELETLNITLRARLRKSILQEAIQGRLVPQDPTDEPASVLLERIQEEKLRLLKEGKLKKKDITDSIIFKGDDNKYFEKIGNEIHCIDEEIPFEIPSTWAWVKLDTICSYIQRGKSPKYSLIKKYPVVAQKCNQWSGFHIEKAQFIEPNSLSSYGEERLLQDGDLMWNSTGLGTLGRMAIYKSDLNPYELAVADSHVTIIRAIKNYTIPEYLYCYFSSNTVQSVIEEKADGSTKQKELATATVKNYIVPLPPLDEQQRIIKRVQELFGLLK